MVHQVMYKCQSLTECSEARPTRSHFIEDFTLLDGASDDWKELFICNSCNQHWIVEKGAEMDRLTNKAFKCTGSEKWLLHDTSPSLTDWLIVQHGGLSNQNCIYSSCFKTALKGMVLCVEHGHSEYKW